MRKPLTRLQILGLLLALAISVAIIVLRGGGHDRSWSSDYVCQFGGFDCPDKR